VRRRQREEIARVSRAHENVAARAEGRPPEEQLSDDPESQAEVILEESELRIEEGARKSND
jgi:hypothetical protein